MNTLKHIVALSTAALLSSAAVAATDAAPKTEYTLYHEVDNATKSNPEMAKITDGIGVYDAKINLLEDYDNDGHYARFEVTYDADDLRGNGLYAYAVVSLVDLNGYAQTLYTGPTFYIYGDTNSDAQRHEFTLQDDYSPGDYRLRVDLYDACCGSLLDTLITSAQEPIPLEGQYFDTISYHEDVYVEEHYYEEDDGGYGGSWGFGGLSLFSLMYVLRRKSLQALHDDAYEEVQEDDE